MYVCVFLKRDRELKSDEERKFEDRCFFYWESLWSDLEFIYLFSYETHTIGWEFFSQFGNICEQRFLPSLCFNDGGERNDNQ